MFQGIPNSGNINRTIGVDIEIPGVFNNPPRYSRIFLLCLIRKLGNKFTDLNDTHTACVLEEVVVFKCGKVVVISLQII